MSDKVLKITKPDSDEETILLPLHNVGFWGDYNGKGNGYSTLLLKKPYKTKAGHEVEKLIVATDLTTLRENTATAHIDSDEYDISTITGHTIQQEACNGSTPEEAAKKAAEVRAALKAETVEAVASRSMASAFNEGKQRAAGTTFRHSPL